MKKNNRKTNSTSTADSTGSSQSVVLDESLEISDAGALLEQLQAAAETNSSLVIDGSQIQVIDTAILQLLVALFRHAERRGTRITWQQPSDTLCQTAALLGLEGHLCLASNPT